MVEVDLVDRGLVGLWGRWPTGEPQNGHAGSFLALEAALPRCVRRGAHKIPTRGADSPGELDRFAPGLYPGCAANPTRHKWAHNLVVGERGVTRGPRFSRSPAPGSHTPRSVARAGIS